MQNHANQPNPAAATKSLPEGWTSETGEPLSPAQIETLKKNLRDSQKRYELLVAAGAPRRPLTPEERSTLSQARQLVGVPDSPHDIHSDTVIDVIALSKKIRRFFGKLALAILLCALGILSGALGVRAGVALFG